MLLGTAQSHGKITVSHVLEWLVAFIKCQQIQYDKIKCSVNAFLSLLLIIFTVINNRFHFCDRYLPVNSKHCLQSNIKYLYIP